MRRHKLKQTSLQHGLILVEPVRRLLSKLKNSVDSPLFLQDFTLPLEPFLFMVR
jgi:hypothetical protein